MWPFQYLALILFIQNVVSSENPEVVTNVGVIRGLKASDGDYAQYMGIPYAYVDELNVWGESILQPPFKEVFEAYDDSARCPQVEEFNNTITGSLDCLHLNIYVPSSASPSNPLPIFVWIYGGYFGIGFHGKFLYGPKYLVRHDVIFITMNYRLGPYGFMCLDTPEVPGNQGLKDQVKALRWIRDNILAFGGDPDRVTVAGNSAGASSIELHVKSDFEQLFDKAILQSGTGMWSIAPADLEYPLELAKAAGYETNDVNEALTYLSSLPPHEVIAASNEINSMITACPEKEFPGVERFISDWTYNLDIPKAKNVTFIIGYNDDESANMFIYTPPEMYPYLNEFFYEEINNNFNITQQESEEWSKLVRRFYIGDRASDSDFLIGFTDFVSDFRFVLPQELLIQEILDSEAAKVYRYFFSYVGKRNFAKARQNITIGGAFHADEIGYLFDMEWMEEPNEDDQLIIDRMTEMWTNFVKYGDPTPSTSELLPLKWLPITAATSHHLEINKQLKTGTRPFNDRMAFWDLFFSKFKKYLYFFNDSDSK